MVTTLMASQSRLVPYSTAYLGHQIVSDNFMPDCLRRIALASTAMSLVDIWQQRNLSLITKIWFYSSCLICQFCCMVLKR